MDRGAQDRALDLDALAAAATEHLVNLIRIDTSNPPGNERAAAAYLERELSIAGVRSTTLERQPGRANLVARLPGSGALAPLLLLGHLDVVPAGPSGWRFPPFSGTVRDGYVWGRGAVDMKHIVAAMLTVITAVTGRDLPLARDLVFAATEDEESAGESGAGWLFREHRQLVDCGMAVTEGGRRVSLDGGSVFALDTAQRGWLTVELIRRSPPGHSSVPARENCLYAIGHVLASLSRTRFPHRATGPAIAFVRRLAELVSEPQATQLLALLDSESYQRAMDALELRAEEKLWLEAMLHSQATPTVLVGGESTWALPQEVRLRLAGRVLPSETREEWLAALESIIGPLGEHETSAFDAGVSGPGASPLFETARTIVMEQHPGSDVIPGMAIAGGDIQHALASGADAIGCFVLADEPGAPPPMSLAHGIDERISLANLRRCVELLWRLVCTEAVEAGSNPRSAGGSR